MHLRGNIRALKTTQAMGRVSGDGKRLLYNSAFKIFFNSVQLLSRVQLSVTPWTEAHQASLSITNSQSLLKLMFIESVMPSNHLILCHPLLLPPSIFPSIRVFSNESALHIRWPKYWSSHYEFLLWIPTVTFLTERKFRGNSLTQVAQWSRIGLPGQETQETWVQSLGREDPLEEGMATCSSILVWRTPWTEEPGGPQSMGSQRVGHSWVTEHTRAHTHSGYAGRKHLTI